MKNLLKHTIAFVGLGSENASTLEYLLRRKLIRAACVFETHSKKELLQRYPSLATYQNIDWAKDTRAAGKLEKYSLIFKSPGAHFSKELRKQLSRSKVEVISPMQLFIEMSPSKQIIGVTGTKGKGSTSSLIAHIFKKAGKKVWLGGNIGVAPFTFIAKIKRSDWVVLELSSFQLEDTKLSPAISVITNFTPEHLKPADPNNPNFHPTLSHYWQSKLGIARYQNSKHVFIVNAKLKEKIKKEKLPGKIQYFSSSNLATSLPGEHNKENIAAAVLAAQAAKVSDKDIAKAVKSFKGLEHRLEKVFEAKGVSFYNDSFSTIPESAETAINAFTHPIILLAGGADKGSDFRKLAKLIARRVKFLILFKGKATPRLKREVLAAGFPKQKIAEVGDMKTAVAISRRHAEKGDVILLSPACASFGIFKNYKDRGKQFIQAVRRL